MCKWLTAIFLFYPQSQRYIRETIGFIRICRSLSAIFFIYPQMESMPLLSHQLIGMMYNSFAG